VQLHLHGKTVLVTGSSKGIGRAIAEAFLAEGAFVAFNARNPDVLEHVVSAQSHGWAIAACGDVCKPDQAKLVVERVISVFGRLDVLVCNVGSGRSVPPGAETHEEWLRLFELNLWSTTNMVQECRLPLMKSGGSIVCISSICGHEVIPGAPIAYSAAKAALNSYVRGMARPLGKDGIRINAISPGNILFEGSIWQKKLDEDHLSVEQILARDVALSKLGSPKEIANLTLLLASPASSFSTGSVVVVDGGQVRG
jgi:3-oxoacyl-[acyl-carrier protein] reductase